jgi:hypothetical protein
MASKFEELVTRFQALGDKTGTNKSTSYIVTLEKPKWHSWSLTLGTYDVADWSRYTELGPYESFDMMVEEFEKVVEKAEQAVANYDPERDAF